MEPSYMPESSRAENTASPECPVRRALDKIEGKWKPYVLVLLEREKTARFNQIKKELPGVTNAALAECLQELAADGLIERVQYNEMPVRVEYALTSLGAQLMPVLCSLRTWDKAAQG